MTTIGPTPAMPPSGVARRLTPKLAERGWAAVPSYLLANAHRIKPHTGARGLNSSEVLFLIHLLDFKWREKDPFPTMGTLATRMSMSTRGVRDIAKRLEDLKLIKRIKAPHGGPNRYRLTQLFEKLEQMMEEDEAVELEGAA